MQSKQQAFPQIGLLQVLWIDATTNFVLSKCYSTAFLIHKNLILTCKHSIFHPKLMAYATVTYFRPGINAMFSQSIKKYRSASNIYYRCNDSLTSFEQPSKFDYAIIKLQESVQNIQPLQLYSGILNKEDLMVRGYPSQTFKRRINLKNCQIKQKYEIGNYKTNQNHIMYYNMVLGEGYSGSPILKMIKDSYKVIGVHSHSIKGIIDQYSCGPSFCNDSIDDIRRYCQQLSNQKLQICISNGIILDQGNQQEQNWDQKSQMHYMKSTTGAQTPMNCSITNQQKINNIYGTNRVMENKNKATLSAQLIKQNPFKLDLFQKQQTYTSCLKQADPNRFLINPANQREKQQCMLNMDITIKSLSNYSFLRQNEQENQQIIAQLTQINIRQQNTIRELSAQLNKISWEIQYFMKKHQQKILQLEDSCLAQLEKVYFQKIANIINRDEKDAQKIKKQNYKLQNIISQVIQKINQIGEHYKAITMKELIQFKQQTDSQSFKFQINFPNNWINIAQRFVNSIFRGLGEINNLQTNKLNDPKIKSVHVLDEQ